MTRLEADVIAAAEAWLAAHRYLEPPEPGLRYSPPRVVPCAGCQQCWETNERLESAIDALPLPWARSVAT